MSTALAEAANAANLTPDGLAAIVGVDAGEVEGWLKSGQVPPAHADAIQEATGFSPTADSADKDTAKPKGGRKTSGKKASAPRSRAVSQLSAEAVRALTVCATLSQAPAERRDLVCAITRFEADGDPAEVLVGMTARILSLASSTEKALHEIGRLLEITNPILVGAELGKHETRELKEIARVCAAVTGRDTSKLPSGDHEAVIAVAEQLGHVAEGEAGGDGPLAWLQTLRA